MSLDFRQLDPAIVQSIKAHAIACYPQEMCGAITTHGWEPLQNRHADPLHHFDCAVDAAGLQQAGVLLAIVHSHPDGPEAPSGDDVAGQLSMDLPWGIVLTDGHAAADPYFWGDSIEPPPLEGRPFRHGPSGTDGKGDCGALLRDWYRLERGVHIPDFARHDNWWAVPGQDLYEQHFAAAGFKPITPDEVQPGDVILMQIRSEVANHGGIYLGGGLVLHHLCDRLSRVDNMLPWLKLVRRVLRHA